ncbi:MAG: YeiH family protein [Gorillibacterium sp.]|nr:YeiH family protein [Gorillibacterium sp.]
MRRIHMHFSFIQGLGLTLGLAIAAKYLAALPLLSIMGQLVLAILLGILWRFVIGVPEGIQPGISFSSKRLLRVGIILLGMRLNVMDIVQAGPKVLLIVVIVITFTLFVVYGISQLFNVDKRLGMLTACGTAICGAAAVVAISPQIKATDEETAISAASIAILGTLFTLTYTLLYPVLGLTATGYGIFSGATLHEVAHVIAAASPGGRAAIDLAVIVKLTRVAMLVPVSLIIGVWANRLERRERNKLGGQRTAQALVQLGKLEGQGQPPSSPKNPVPIPWFIFGFLIMSGVNTWGILSSSLVSQIIIIAYLLIAMAMAGLGLKVDIAAFRRLGLKSFTAGLIGSLLLSLLGFGLVHLLGLA